MRRSNKDPVVEHKRDCRTRGCFFTRNECAVSSFRRGTNCPACSTDVRRRNFSDETSRLLQFRCPKKPLSALICRGLFYEATCQHFPQRQSRGPAHPGRTTPS